MDIQSVITHVIEAFFMSFVALVLFQFITGLFVEYNRAITAEFASIYAEAIAPITTSVSTPIAEPAQPTATEFVLTDDPWQEPQFAQLPDPWFSTDVQPTAIQQEPVVLEFPTLRLLPPAASVLQPKARAMTKSNKSTQPKSTKTSKTSQSKTAVTPRKSRKKSAAA